MLGLLHHYRLSEQEQAAAPDAGCEHSFALGWPSEQVDSARAWTERSIHELKSRPGQVIFDILPTFDRFLERLLA